MSFLLLSGDGVGTQTLGVSASAVLTGTVTKTVSANACLQGVGTKTVSTSAVLFGSGLTKTVSASGYLQGAGILPVSANAVLKQSGLTKTVTTSAVLQKQGVVTWTLADAVLYVPSGTFTKTVTASAHLVTVNTKTVTANAILRKAQSTSCVANAILYTAAGPGPSTPLAYQTDQQVDYLVEYWDTPFSTLYNNVASNGMRMDVYEPPTGFGATFEAAASGSALTTAWSTLDPAVLPNGRMPNAIGYWAGGAPGQHGVSVARRVAYRIQGTVKSGANRAWLSASTSFTMKFAVAGSGRMRITVNGTDVLPTGSRQLTEAGFLTNGPTYSTPVSLTTGDNVVIYYVQDEESWGGFVVKAVLPESDGGYYLDTYQEAPVVGSGLLDYGTAPTATTLGELLHITTEITPNQARRASIQVPLVPISTYDGVGWEWQRTNDETGFLRLHRVGVANLDVRRQRLVRIWMGYRSLTTGLSDLKPVFTGWTDDFEVRDGVATITCLGFEQRLVDQFVKNYPDRISYMAFGYGRLKGSTEPIFNVPAYDNWPIEYVFRDLLVRAGIDEARLRAPTTVRQPNNGSTTVTM